MKVLKKLVVAMFVLIIIAVGVGVLLPSSVHVERSTTISAPPDKVFNLINGYASFNKWSPWYEKDPDAVFGVEGPPTGVGARMVWTSDMPEVGSGSQEIIESQPNQLVKTHLDFGTQGTATATFQIEPTNGGSRVTWSLDAAFGYDLVGRYFGLLFDRMIGPDYEKGLANLRRLAESG